LDVEELYESAETQIPMYNQIEFKKQGLDLAYTAQPAYVSMRYC